MQPIIGIIGGMGPEATVDLMRRVIAKTPARDDADHLHLVVESNPKIPSRIAHLIDGTGADPTPELIRIARNLENAGAQVLAMPCNTAHAYAGAIRAAVGIPLLDMVNLTVADIVTSIRGHRVGVLASSAVHKTQLYARALSAHGLIAVEPQDQDAVMTLIKGVKRGDVAPAAQRALSDIVRTMTSQSDTIVVACSELSVIAGAIDVPFVDSLDVLARAVVGFAR